MNNRLLGKTGLRVSELGFGCGSVGGIIIRADRPTRVRAVARAIELGINYFDTARIYGDGQSETNLGEALKELGADVLVGTKVRLTADEMREIGKGISASVEGSLRRIGREQVDLIQLHNGIGLQRQPDRGWIGVDDLEAVVRAFQALQQQGKARFWGLNGLGESKALHQAIASTGTYTIQAMYNLINPTAGTPAPPGFPYQDYGQLIDRAAGQQIGVIAIRVLAAGALSGTADRHPIAAQSVEPIASGPHYEDDAARARAFSFLVEEGYAGSLVEAAIRFALAKAEISTVLVGISSLEQLEQAAAYANKGPLPSRALERLREAWAAFT
jgi:aryl-alcohol dehydrogenase-like predicted oxidoreductase